MHTKVNKTKLPYIARKFGGLTVYITTTKLKIRHNFLLAYIRTCMAIPYRTAKFKSVNILAIAILGSTAKFNSCQLFPAIRYYTTIYTFLETLVVSHHIRMSQLFPHNLHFIQQPAKVSALFDGRAPETSVATSYLLQCQELFPLSDLVDFVDATESS